jgi:hypothetical protein
MTYATSCSRFWKQSGPCRLSMRLPARKLKERARKEKDWLLVQTQDGR